MKTNIILILTIGFRLSASAQQYSLDWHSIGGGGGQSAGGVYSVSGTVGQSAAGALAGGAFTLESGFWSMVAVVPTPDAPALAVALIKETVVLSWPLTATGFVLEQTALVPGDSKSWTQVPAGSYRTNDVNLSAVFPVLPGCQFFRLRQP